MVGGVSVGPAQQRADPAAQRVAGHPYPRRRTAGGRETVPRGLGKDVVPAGAGAHGDRAAAGVHDDVVHAAQGDEQPVAVLGNNHLVPGVAHRDGQPVPGREPHGGGHVVGGGGADDDRGPRGAQQVVAGALRRVVRVVRGEHRTLDGGAQGGEVGGGDLSGRCCAHVFPRARYGRGRKHPPFPRPGNVSARRRVHRMSDTWCVAPHVNFRPSCTRWPVVDAQVSARR